MYKSLVSLMCTVSLFLAFFPATAGAEPVGMLRGQVIQTGSHPTNPIGKTSTVTDNDFSTFFNLRSEIESRTVNDFLIYQFSTPVDITAYKLYIENYNKYTLTFIFYDSANKEITRFRQTISGDNGIYPFAKSIEGVKKMVVWNSVKTNPTLKVLEWDVYNIPVENPTTLTASGGDRQATLTWDQVPEADSYTVRYGTEPGKYTETLTVTKDKFEGLVIPELTNGITYYFNVIPIVNGVEFLPSNEASATPEDSEAEEPTTPGEPGTEQPGTGEPTNPEEPGTEEPTVPEQPSGNRAILVVTMTTGLEKEFDLSMKEVNDFIAWYEAKQAGSGKASYAINKHDNNKGPFSSRKDYILYDRVLTFEVSEY
ncbi:hypothetical protein [Paenibacillus sp. FSL K6-1230]|uniref:hypothetical protein n=1 Tax=Paenibacillus sp. FSL K6-1230 TaxID=2921603 RepID=UPI0030FAE50A